MKPQRKSVNTINKKIVAFRLNALHCVWIGRFELLNSICYEMYKVGTMYLNVEYHNIHGKGLPFCRTKF